MPTIYPVIRVSRLALCEGNCKKPVYAMHKWWARRLGTVFRMLLINQGLPSNDTPHALWKSFYQPTQLPKDFTVLDPFLGGGTSLVEAAKLGASCIGVDIDPVACFVTRMELEGTDPDTINADFKRIEGSVATKLRDFYRTEVDGQPADVIYYFWVDRITCPDCGSEHDGHPTYQLAYDSGKDRQWVTCPCCGHIGRPRISTEKYQCRGCRARIDLTAPPVQFGQFTCPSCTVQKPLSELYQAGAVTQRMFALEYLDADGRRGFAPISPGDVKLYERAEAALKKTESVLPIPNTDIPTVGRVDKRPISYGYTRYRDMFNSRQLYCLGVIGDEIRKVTDLIVKRSLALAFSHALATNNMFCGYAFGYRRLTPLFSVHSYRKISRPVEGNVWGVDIGRGTLKNAVRAVIAGCEYMRAPYELQYVSQRPYKVAVAPSSPRERSSVQILNQSSESLAPLANHSVDLILTDPPYFDNISYSELADFYHVWLRELLGQEYPGYLALHTPMKDALYAGRRGEEVDPAATVATFRTSLAKILTECSRVLKPTGRLAFTYHHRADDAWECLGNAVLSAGFRIEETFPVRSEGRSGLHSYVGSIKWDAVFICTRGSRSAPRFAGSPQSFAAARKAAIATARDWRRRIRSADLEFSEADELSLIRALVLREFSSRNLNASNLAGCLSRLPTTVKRSHLKP